MFRKIVILSVFIFSYFQLLCQTDRSKEQYDRITANLFEYGQWKALTRETDTALKDNIDFYELRYRTGIAYFKSKNYVKAIIHFKQALNLNPADTVSLEYLYFAYSYLKRNMEADQLLKKNHIILTYTLRKSEHKPFLKNAEIIGGYMFSDNKTTNEKTDVNGTENIWGQQVLFGNLWFSGLTLTHRLFKNVYLNHAYNYLNIERWENYGINNRRFSYQNDVQQQEYYLSTELLLGGKYYIKPALHFLFINFKVSTPAPPQPETSTNISLDHQVYYLGVFRNFSILNIGVSGSWSNLNTTKQINREQIQGNFTISIFPKGNLDIYSVSNIIYQNQENKDKVFLDQKIGLKVYKKIWLEGTATVGRFDNLVLDYGYNIFNVPNYVKYKFGLNLLATISKHLQFSLYYSYSYRDDYYYKENSTNQIESIKFNYQTNSITGGLKWTF
jgi:hypothetical protein